jgi:hypothetical protein
VGLPRIGGVDGFVLLLWMCFVARGGDDHMMSTSRGNGSAPVAATLDTMPIRRRDEYWT